MQDKCDNPACNKELSGLVLKVGRLEFCCLECKDAAINPETAENDRNKPGGWD